MKCAVDRTRAKESRDQVGALFLSVLDSAAGMALRRDFRWTAAAVQRMYDETKQTLSDVMVRSMAADTTGDIRVDYDDTDMIRDTAESAMWMMQSHLRECGFDFRAAEQETVWYDPLSMKYMNSDLKSVHRNRLEWAKNEDVIVRVYLLNLLEYVRKLGFGKTRLSRLYRTVRSEYNAFVEAWLKCDCNIEELYKRYAEKNLSELEKSGIAVEEYGKIISKKHTKRRS